MIMTRWTRAIIAAFFACAALSSSAYAQKIKVGYWTSGVSLGFGSTLEQMKFLEKQGLDVEWIKFGDVNAPTRAIVSNATTQILLRQAPQAIDSIAAPMQWAKTSIFSVFVARQT